MRQNHTHAYRLRNVLPKDVPIIPIVVLVQDNTQFLNSEEVIPLSELKVFLQEDRGYRLTPLQMEKAAQMLEEARSEDVTMREHISNIHRIQDKLARNICPRCGGRLVLREGKYGPFYGCENYPKCRFKKKAE